MIVKVNGFEAVRTHKSKILGIDSKQEADWFVEAYEKLFGQYAVTTQVEDPFWREIMEENEE